MAVLKFMSFMSLRLLYLLPIHFQGFFNLKKASVILHFYKQLVPILMLLTEVQSKPEHFKPAC